MAERSISTANYSAASLKEKNLILSWLLFVEDWRGVNCYVTTEFFYFAAGLLGSAGVAQAK